MDSKSFGAAFVPFVQEVAELLPEGTTVIDAHAHLGTDEDGRSQDPPALLAQLDTVGAQSRACVFPFHDPDRSPGYRGPMTES